MGEVVLVGDFSVRIASHQTSFFNISDGMFREVDTFDVGMSLEDNATSADYEEHLLALGDTHGLAI